MPIQTTVWTLGLYNACFELYIIALMRSIILSYWLSQILQIIPSLLACTDAHAIRSRMTVELSSLSHLFCSTARAKSRALRGVFGLFSILKTAGFALNDIVLLFELSNNVWRSPRERSFSMWNTLRNCLHDKLHLEGKRPRNRLRSHTGRQSVDARCVHRLLTVNTYSRRIFCGLVSKMHQSVKCSIGVAPYI